MCNQCESTEETLAQLEANYLEALARLTAFNIWADKLGIIIPEHLTEI